MTRSYLPIMLDVTNRRLLLIGGGRVAWQKIQTLQKFTNQITVLAAQISPQVQSSGWCCIEKHYESADLAGYDLIYACTNDRELNRRIAHDGAMAHKLVNVVDDAYLSDFISPAVFKRDEMIVAVSSSGTAVRQAIAWRDKIAGWLADER
ncbi:MAG: bifunctional precorrin-2 dehydrogenase/sirohydrochlorin ferrochelatase [Bacillota bacterium]